MRKVLAMILGALLFSCNSYLDKSIFEPLSVEDLKKSMEKDSIFEDVYSVIVKIRDSVLKSDIDKVKFADLTYDQVYEFVKSSTDTAFLNPAYERFYKEWDEKYGFYDQKVDSILSYWRKFKEENSLDSYVKIELVEIDKEYYRYSGGLRDVNLGFRLTPLKGKIEQMRFGFDIQAKINEKDEQSLFSSLYSALDKSWCLTTTPFSKPVVRYWEASYSHEEILKNKTLSTFKRDYNLLIEVDQIRIEGVNISNDDLNIPESVSNQLNYEDRGGEFDLYSDEIIKEVLGKEYIKSYAYTTQEIEKILREKDPLAYEFLKLLDRK